MKGGYRVGWSAEGRRFSVTVLGRRNGEVGPARPLAVLCGSVTRATAALDAAEVFYRRAGYDVVRSVARPDSDPEVLFRRHCAAIRSGGRPVVAVVCLPPYEPIGDLTMREWRYAADPGVPVTVGSSVGGSS